MKTSAVQSTQPAPLLNGPYLVRPEEFYARVGLGAQRCRDLEKAGVLPKRIYLSPTTVRWRSDEMFAYLANVFNHGARTPEDAAAMKGGAMNDGSQSGD